VQVDLSNFGIRVIFSYSAQIMKIYSIQLQDLISTQDMELQKHRSDLIIMKSKNLIQYGSRSGITSYGSKIEDMSCYKMLPAIQNEPPKVECAIKTKYNKS
jgi:hypothetical protein